MRQSGTPVLGCSEYGGYPERSTTMNALSLILVVVQIVAVASANRYHSPISGCQVTLDNYRFDLCPLLNQRNNYSGYVHLVLHHQTPPTITTILYNISLNGPLQRSDAISDEQQVSLVVMNCCVQSNEIFQCVSGTWACLSSKPLSASLVLFPPSQDLSSLRAQAWARTWKRRPWSKRHPHCPGSPTK